jgi:hypothetical protein
MEVITIAGGPRTSNIVVIPSAATSAGARATLLFKLPLTSGITIEVYGNNISSPVIAQFTTDGVQTTATFELYFDGSTWQLAESLIPS